MKLKYLVPVLSLFAVSLFAINGESAKAEEGSGISGTSATTSQIDNSGRGSFKEDRKRLIEARREAEKKLIEATREADPAKRAELRREAQIKLNEATREAFKDLKDNRGKASATATSTRGRNGDDKDDDGDDSIRHRSKVSEFVRRLHILASTTPGRIGEQVRVVAREQNDKASTTALAIKKVESRKALVKFLIGADFKNLGQLRSSMVTAENHINRLTDIKSKASSTPEVQAELDKEIQLLNAEKERLANIVKTNDSNVSLFGWLIKLMRK